MDEVNELLEKEKTLYRLQAMEANAAAEAWKSKYENLIGDVADTAALSNYQTCEIAAGIEATSSAGTSKDEKPKIANLDRLLALSDSRTINISNHRLIKSDITNLTKAVRDQTHSNPYFIVMRHNNLNDSDFSSSNKPNTGDVFSPLISAPLVEALDFLYNDFGAGFENTPL